MEKPLVTFEFNLEKNGSSVLMNTLESKFQGSFDFSGGANIACNIYLFANFILKYLVKMKKRSLLVYPLHPKQSSGTPMPERPMVMTSEMFGLSAALDTHTQDLLARKRHISGQDELSEDDRKALKEINEELQRMTR